MSLLLEKSEFADLHQKVLNEERLTEADALRLFETKDLNALGALANIARAKKVGRKASYIINRYINTRTTAS